MAETLRFKVEGMDCASCARTVETGVSRIAGVSGISINTTTETLSLSAAGAGTAEMVSSVIRELGYRPTLLGAAASPAAAGTMPARPDRGHTHHGHDHDDDH